MGLDFKWKFVSKNYKPDEDSDYDSDNWNEEEHIGRHNHEIVSGTFTFEELADEIKSQSELLVSAIANIKKEKKEKEIREPWESSEEESSEEEEWFPDIKDIAESIKFYTLIIAEMDEKSIIYIKIS